MCMCIVYIHDVLFNAYIVLVHGTGVRSCLLPYRYAYFYPALVVSRARTAGMWQAREEAAPRCCILGVRWVRVYYR